MEFLRFILLLMVLFFIDLGVSAQNKINPINKSLDKSFENISESNQWENFLDFWIGEWEVSWEEGDNRGKGTNRIHYILDSTAIQEDFKVTHGLMKGFKGISLSSYNHNFHQWKQVWIDNKGGYYEFTSKINSKSPIFVTDLFEKNGKEHKFRMVFKEIKPTSLIWDWEKSTDNGKTWKLKWRIFYTKK